MKPTPKLRGKKILVTGGAGFIGSNLCEYLLESEAIVYCLDNFATGHRYNIELFLRNENFTLIEGDIRDLATCQQACKRADFVLHQAALGSVPRSIEDPITSNEVNVSGFLNMLVASRDQRVKRFVYAASSSTYGDSKELPKVEDRIGKPLSPYAVTKYVNELYADVFARTYDMQCIGLRYFNVFGRRQHPNGAYAAVIPLWVKAFLNHQSPVINGDGSYSRDFTYIDNVIQANELALLTPASDILEQKAHYEARVREVNASEPKRPAQPGTDYPTDKNFSSSQEESPTKEGEVVEKLKVSFHEVFNIAYGQNTTLLQLFEALRDNLASFDDEIKLIEPAFNEFRHGDIPHSLADIQKAKFILNYNPIFDARLGFEKACSWYYKYLKHD